MRVDDRQVGFDDLFAAPVEPFRADRQMRADRGSRCRELHRLSSRRWVALSHRREIIAMQRGTVARLPRPVSVQPFRDIRRRRAFEQRDTICAIMLAVADDDGPRTDGTQQSHCQAQAARSRVEAPRRRALYLFGSTARGEAAEDPDVDLFFDHPEGTLGLFALMDVKEVAADPWAQNRYHDAAQLASGSTGADRGLGAASVLI